MSAKLPPMRFSLGAGALLAAAASFTAPASAESVAPNPEQIGVAELERAFWFCDFVATTKGVQATPIAACRHATEQLKKQKFSGDFDEFVAWWRSNKAAEHLKLHQQQRNDASA